MQAIHQVPGRVFGGEVLLEGGFLSQGHVEDHSECLVELAEVGVGHHLRRVGAPVEVQELPPAVDEGLPELGEEAGLELADQEPQARATPAVQPRVDVRSPGLLGHPQRLHRHGPSITLGDALDRRDGVAVDVGRRGAITGRLDQQTHDLTFAAGDGLPAALEAVEVGVAGPFGHRILRARLGVFHPALGFHEPATREHREAGVGARGVARDHHLVSRCAELVDGHDARAHGEIEGLSRAALQPSKGRLDLRKAGLRAEDRRAISTEDEGEVDVRSGIAKRDDRGDAEGVDVLVAARFDGAGRADHVGDHHRPAIGRVMVFRAVRDVVEPVERSERREEVFVHERARYQIKRRELGLERSLRGIP